MVKIKDMVHLKIASPPSKPEIPNLESPWFFWFYEEILNWYRISSICQVLPVHPRSLTLCHWKMVGGWKTSRLPNCVSVTFQGWTVKLQGGMLSFGGSIAMFTSWNIWNTLPRNEYISHREGSSENPQLESALLWEYVRSLEGYTSSFQYQHPSGLTFMVNLRHLRNLLFSYKVSKFWWLSNFGTWN